MAVLRNSISGEITHVKIHAINGVQYYLSKRDYDLFMSHQVTEDEVLDFLGQKYILQELVNIANGGYPDNILKYDIMNYAELFNDPVIS